MTATTTTRPEIAPGTWTLDKAHTRIEFLAKHLMVTKVRGHFAEYDAVIQIAPDLAESRLEITFQADSITTGADERDAHLRSADFLDAANHPVLTFTSTDLERDGDEWKMTGDLTIRGTTRPIVVTAEYEGSAVDPWGREHIGFSATTRFDREDWGLTWNAALEGGGWLVSKDVRVEIEGQLIRV
jgi:polyisoprenoid-binding protein YceI